MIFDDLDFFILGKIYDEDITTWEIAKEYFKNTDSVKLNYKHQLIKRRLEKMEKIGLIFIEGNRNKRKKYLLVEDNILFGKHKFPNGYRDAILIKESGKWMVFQI